MTYIPHRYSDKSVIRFVPILKSLVDQHAKNGVASVKFNPLELNISMETAISRLRDAAHSLIEGISIHPSIDPGILKTIWPLYKVTSDGIHVMVVSRQTEQSFDPTPILQGSTTSLATLKCDEAGFVEELTAFAVLLSRRHLRGQVDIIGDLSESLRHRIESEHDVVFIPDGQQKHHMI